MPFVVPFVAPLIGTFGGPPCETPLMGTFGLRCIVMDKAIRYVGYNYCRPGAYISAMTLLPSQLSARVVKALKTHNHKARSGTVSSAMARVNKCSALLTLAIVYSSKNCYDKLRTTGISILGGSNEQREQVQGGRGNGPRQSRGSQERLLCCSLQHR